jgi:hypothetical protein
LLYGRSLLTFERADTELKAKIEAFKEERKAVKRQALAAVETMDTSTG